MIQQIKEKLNFLFFCKITPAVIFMFLICLIMIKSFPGEVSNCVSNTKFTSESLFALTEEFENVLQNNIYKKSDFINLNGLVARVLGQNSLNERQKLANGALTSFSSPATIEVIERSANRVGELEQFLEDKGIPFLYILAPNKSTIYDAEFAPGYGEGSKQDIENMITALVKNGVSTIDVNAWFEKNEWHLEDLMFKTDHHWKPETALYVAHLTMEYLEQQEISDYNEELFLEESWTVEVWEDHFLGSDGQRVGIPYAGMDDISIYKPNFSTEYHYSRLLYGETTWIYSDDLLDESYKDREEYYTDCPYNAYMYGDSPLRITQNNLGWNKQRILIMGDSFKMPYEYFLTTQFQEVYTMDLRYYTDGTFVQAVEEIKPDIVLMCTNAPTHTALHEFGLESYRIAMEESKQYGLELRELNDFTLEAQEENNDYFTVIHSELEAGKTYTLTVGNTEIQGGEDCFIQMSLYNLSTNKAVYNHYFTASCNDAQKWVFTVPDKKTDTFAIYLYAGTKGHTAKVFAEIKDVKLYQGIMTD